MTLKLSEKATVPVIVMLSSPSSFFDTLFYFASKLLLLVHHFLLPALKSTHSNYAIVKESWSTAFVCRQGA